MKGKPQMNLLIYNRPRSLECICSVNLVKLYPGKNCWYNEQNFIIIQALMTCIHLRPLICLSIGKDFGWNNEGHIMSSFLENPNLWMYMLPWISQWNSCRTIQIPKGWCHQSFPFLMSGNVSKSGRPSSGHRTGKGQFFSQFPRRVVPKNVLTIQQLHSSPMLVRYITVYLVYYSKWFWLIENNLYVY